MNTKSCTRCYTDRPLSAFAACAGGRDGLRAHCRDCYNATRRLNYAQPAVNAEKNAKRRVYEATRADARKVARHHPDIAARERAARQKYRADPQNLARMREWRVGHEAVPECRARVVFKAAMARAQKQQLPFGLTEAWVVERVLAGRCEVTGLPFEFSRVGTNTRRNPFAPSIDQITAGAGYTPKNCRVVLTAVNLALCDWGLPMFLHIASHALERNGYSVAEQETRKAA